MGVTCLKLGLDLVLTSLELRFNIGIIFLKLGLDLGLGLRLDLGQTSHDLILDLGLP